MTHVLLGAAVFMVAQEKAIEARTVKANHKQICSMLFQLSVRNGLPAVRACWAV
jgi:hypothetical protein